MKYFIAAGEASGDIHGASLITELRRLDSQAEFTVIGGKMMEQASGSCPLIDYRSLAFMGFSDVLRNIRTLSRYLALAKEQINACRPDAIILIDYPSFNMKLAKHAAKQGIPVYYYIAPKVWAWKKWRIKSLRRYCRKVLSILPFEVDFFRKNGLEVVYVGNPSVEEVDARIARLPSLAEFCRKWNLDAGRQLLAIVPGSRQSEIRNNLPLMVDAASRFSEYQAVVAGAPGIDPLFYKDYAGGLPIVEGATFELVAMATAALVTSGTATLEAALSGTPQVVCYRGGGSKLTYKIMSHVLTCPFVSLPNLIVNRAIVPELLEHLCTADSMADYLARILSSVESGRVSAGKLSFDRESMLSGYADLRRALGETSAAENGAKTIVADLREVISCRPASC